MSWKRQIADAVGRAFGVHIVRRGSVWRVLQIDCLEQFLQAFKVDCVFDVGANKGQFVERVRAGGYRGQIISFEPIPDLADLLRTKAKSDRQWLIEEVALDEVARPVTFNVLGQTQLSSMRARDGSGMTTFPDVNRAVRSLSLTSGVLEHYYDRYRARLGFSRPFLKIDAQGHDVSVAKGAGQRLAEFVGLQTELAVKRVYRDQETYREAIDFYERQGFELSSFGPNSGGQFPILLEFDCIMFNSRFAAEAQSMIVAKNGI